MKCRGLSQGGAVAGARAASGLMSANRFVDRRRGERVEDALGRARHRRCHWRPAWRHVAIRGAGKDLSVASVRGQRGGGARSQTKKRSRNRRRKSWRARAAAARRQARQELTAAGHARPATSDAFGADQQNLPLRELQRRADEDRDIRDRWHIESRAAIAALTRKLDQHAAAVAAMRPAVAALELSRSKLAAWASIGLAGVVVFGWIVEASVKWAVTRAWAHFQ
jgi:hypothetical protein